MSVYFVHKKYVFININQNMFKKKIDREKKYLDTTNDQH